MVLQNINHQTYHKFKNCWDFRGGQATLVRELRSHMAQASAF